MTPWYLTMIQHPSNLDSTFYVWVHDEINKILCPVGTPEGISSVAPIFIKLIRATACSTNLVLQGDLHGFFRKWLSVRCVNAAW